MSSKKSTDYTFNELVEKVAKHFNLRPSATMQRYKFNSRCRQASETVADYVATLRMLSENCEFGNSLNDMLRNRLVWGIDDSKIQQRLLDESFLTFGKALEIAQASELATRDLKDLQSSVGDLQYTGYTRPAQRGTVLCYRCGGNHTAAHCQF